MRGRSIAVAIASAIAGCNAGSPSDARAPVTTVAIPTAAASAAPQATSSAVPVSDDPILDAVGGPKLTPRERDEWGTYMTELLAPCPNVAVSVAECITGKRSCAECVPAARFLLRKVRDGRPREQVARDYKRRFDPAAVRAIPTEGSPVFGPVDAPVAVVVFSDFQCPACGVAAPLLESVVSQSRGARLVYKFVALDHHPYAEIAARAAIAAGVQGKFWEMHHEIFAHQGALDQRDLERYAKALGLDTRRLAADMKSTATSERIGRDAALWKSLGLVGTPTVFVDGRELALDEIADLHDWIADLLAARDAKPR